MAFEVNDPSEDVMSEINMTPLVDIMLVLLIIFIITVPVIQHAVRVELPRASSERDRPPAAQLQLTVNAQGQVFLDAEPVADADLEEVLRQQAGKSPQPQLYLRGDKKVPYEHVAKAMAAAHRAGLKNLGFVTEASTP